MYFKVNNCTLDFQGVSYLSFKYSLMRNDQPFRVVSMVISIFLFFACENEGLQKNDGSISESTITDTTAILNDPKNNLNVQTNIISEVDSSGIVMFPLSMGETIRNGESYPYRENPYNNYWNIIFYNSHTSEYHLLADKKILIKSIHIYHSTNDYLEMGYTIRTISFTTNHIFYIGTTDDFNSDGKITPDDPDYLFVSDKAGHNFRQISPAGIHVKSWKIIKSTNKIIMSVIKDSDKNYKFGEKDEVSSYQITVDKENQASEIFSNEFKKKLKVFFDKDWKRMN